MGSAEHEPIMGSAPPVGPMGKAPGGSSGGLAPLKLKAFTFMRAKFCMNIQVFNDFQQLYLCHKMAKKPAITTDVTLVVETLSPTSQCKTKQTKANKQSATCIFV
jgi:hypothetical protein